MKWQDRVRWKAAEIRAIGLGGVLARFRHRVFGHASPFLGQNAELFRGRGLELGGPSPMFAAGGYAAVYPIVDALDNVNFHSSTRWEGHIEAGRTFRFREDAQPGLQLVHEATALTSVQDAAYDFLLSSHMLEHTANPLKALHEWKRVMREEGTLLLVLPHKDGTFDHRRPTTPLSHMIDDYERGVGEDDTTHFDEILRLHDLKRDIWQASAESFRAWLDGNTVNRGAHHHVFDSLAAAQMVDAAGFRLLCVEPAELDSVLVFARKPRAGEVPNNAAFTRAGAAFLRASPFASDRRRWRSGH